MRFSADIEVEVFSFDVDGTLVSKRFTDAVWLRGIPELYAKKEGLSFDDAHRIVKSEYEKVGEENINWYKIDYWLRKFGLETTAEELFMRYRNEVHIYEEVEHVLSVLKEAGYELIISSNAAREFIDFQIAPIKGFFSHIFSATSDFDEVKKSNSFYTRVCRILDVRPQNVVHVGDHWVFDFLNPRAIGINAYFLDRSGDKIKRGQNKNTNDAWQAYIISNLADII